MRCLIGCIILLGSTAFPFLMLIQQTTAQDLVQDNFLVVAVANGDKGTLYQIDLRSGAMNPLLTTSAVRPVAVAFDSVEMVVYWTDVERRLIGKTCVEGNQRNSMVILKDSTGTLKLRGLALDIKSRKLYCADPGNSRIHEMNLDGSRRIFLTPTSGMQPEALVVDAINRDLYYTDRGVQPGIHVISLTTWQHRTILTENMVWPNALAIDFEGRVMCWSDEKFGRIEMANLDGSGRVTLMTGTHARYFALGPDYLYFTIWNNTSINRLDRRTHTMAGKLPTVMGKDGLYGIVFYNSSFAKDTRKPGDDKTLGPNRYSSSLQTHHKVLIVFVPIGAIVSITGIVAVRIARRRSLSVPYVRVNA